jgi:hypothetical protein
MIITLYKCVPPLWGRVAQKTIMLSKKHREIRFKESTLAICSHENGTISVRLGRQKKCRTKIAATAGIVHPIAIDRFYISKRSLIQGMDFYVKDLDNITFSREKK